MAEPRDMELRGSVTKTFLQRLDAVAQADGMGRIEWMVPIVEKEVERRIQAATVIVRMVGANPPKSERGGD